MSEPGSQVRLMVNGVSVEVPYGTTVAAAMVANQAYCRTSVNGEPRGPLCGMGICFECRALINGQAHSRSCQVLCQPDMDVRTNQ
jgi:sarcosine oxidase subunit alpha